MKTEFKTISLLWADDVVPWSYLWKTRWQRRKISGKCTKVEAVTDTEGWITSSRKINPQNSCRLGTIGANAPPEPKATVNELAEDLSSVHLCGD